MNFKYLFHITLILFIFSKINAFVVDNYADAVASYRTTSKSTHILNLLNQLKEHIARIEIVYSDNQKQFVYGYVFKDVFIIMSSFLLEKNLLKIKQIKYEYNHKPIMEDVILLNKSHYRRFVCGTFQSDISDSKEDTLSKYGVNFVSFDHLNEPVFRVLYKSFLNTRNSLSEVNSEFKKNLWGSNIGDFFDMYLVTDNIAITHGPMNQDSWFIIGKPNGEIAKELEPIPLKYISDDISAISVRFNDKVQQKILMFVSGVKFQNYDLGAILVNCDVNRMAGKECKFFGQITKIVTNDGHKQTIVVELIFQSLLRRAKFDFQRKIVDPSMKQDELPIIASPITTKLSMQTGDTTSTSISSSNKGFKLDDPDYQKKTHILDHQSVEWLGDELDFQKKRIKISPAQKPFILDGWSCEDLNFYGNHILNEYVKIMVDEIELFLSNAEVIGKYHIIGTYTEKGETFQFNLCYKVGGLSYLIQEEELYQ